MAQAVSIPVITPGKIVAHLHTAHKWLHIAGGLILSGLLFATLLRLALNYRAPMLGVVELQTLVYGAGCYYLGRP